MPKRIAQAVCFALSAVLLSAVPLGHDRAAAREAFSQAEEYLEEQQARPPAEREIKHYNRAIYLFRLVIDYDPTYGGADDALYEIARLYEEKAERFKREGDLRRAIHYYEFLAAEYPTTKHRREAVSRAAALRAPKAAESRQTKPAAAAPASPGAAEVSETATVDKIRYWSGPEYTRVVIDLDHEVRFAQSTLENPYRLYFDLIDARLRSGLQRVHQVNDSFIESVRVGQNRPRVVRVVLDFASHGQTTVFPLYDPFRIVIDTRSGRGKRGQAQARQGATQSAEISLEDSADGTAAASESPSAAGTNPSAEASPPQAAPPRVPDPNVQGDFTLTRMLGLKVGRIVLDPGHGGHDTGTIGPSGLKEKDLVLDVAKRLKKLVEDRLGLEVLMTRDSDRFIPLEERTAIANQNSADVFLSIHANASRNRKASGVETFFLNLASDAHERDVATRENASSQRNIRELEDLLRKITRGDYNEESRDFAFVMQEHLAAKWSRQSAPTRDRGVKQAPFIVLIGSNMPAVLTEIGFISNPADEKLLRKDDSRGHVAEALYAGVEHYLRSLGDERARADARTGSR